MTRSEYEQKRRVIEEAFEVDLLTRDQALRALRILRSKMRAKAAAGEAGT